MLFPFIVLTTVVSATSNAQKDSGLANKQNSFDTVKNQFSKENIEYLKQHVKKTSDSGFKVYLDNIERINAVLGKDEAESIITAAIEASEIKPYMEEGKIVDWQLIKDKVSIYKSLGEETLLQFQTLYALNNRESALFNAVAKPWYEKYGKRRKWISEFLLNEMAWIVFLYFDETEALKTALLWSKRVIEKEPTTNNYDTYANLLHKLGRTNEAIRYQQKALEVAGQTQDLTEIRENLEKMKAGQKTWE